jgi:hypothetical protein
MVLSESMFLAALFPVLIACERAARTGDRRDALIAGAAAGALALVRTIGAVAIPATALTLAIRKRWVPAALVWVAGLAVMLPWQLWIATYDSQLPDVFLGRYGSYGGWLMSGIREGGIAWIGQLIVFNLDELSDGMSLLLTVDHLPVAIRWLGTLAIAGFFAGGWLKMLRRAPVAAWTVAIYLAVIISWPFEPPRFIFAVWPVIGMIMGLSVHSGDALPRYAGCRGHDGCGPGTWLRALQLRRCRESLVVTDTGVRRQSVQADGRVGGGQHALGCGDCHR